VTGMDVTSIMSSSKLFYWPAIGACMTFVAVVAASLLIGGVANAVPLEGTPQLTEALAPIATSTALAVSPVSSVAQGIRVTLTATITPSTAVGTVQFKDATTDIGAPVTVSNNGTASGSTSTLAPGPHQLTAVFTPADPAAFSPSTSPAIPLTVTGSAAGTPQTGTHQQSALSLDIQVSILGDPDNQVVILDDCGCSSGGEVSIPVLDGRATTLDRRPSVLDSNGLLGGIVSGLLD
jgi:Bacterial Ig-like domain (group 3)